VLRTPPDHLGDRAAVPIGVAGPDGHGLAEGQVRCRLLGTAGELLAGLQGVDAARRILTCWFSSVRTVIVSPSAVPTTRAQ
jgi:hypothetical protein